MDSVHIWRLAIHSLTVYRIRPYLDDPRDVALMSLKQAMLAADRLDTRDAAPPPFLAMLLCRRKSNRPSAPATNNFTAAADERCTGKKAREGAHAQYVAVEKPLRIAGCTP